MASYRSVVTTRPVACDRSKNPTHLVGEREKQEEEVRVMEGLFYQIEHPLACLAHGSLVQSYEVVYTYYIPLEPER